MNRPVFFLYLIFHTCGLISQPQTNNWYFSSNNGLSFSSGTPAIVSGGQIVAQEGASAISDNNGQLLFYTDGITVWNRQHGIMPNGRNLHGGHSSSTQSSVIIPKTPDGTQYYIFTADDEGESWGLQYSVVDMTLNSGMGDVSVLNVPLIAPTSEKVTAVRHCNKKDYWVITHEYNSDAYYAYLATATGVNSVPVISHTGSFIPDAYGTMAGALKSSPDGKRLVAAHGTIGVEVMDFNNQTGQVSNAVEIFNNSNALPYGVEFSSNSSKLYVSVTHYWDAADVKRYSGVFQFDLSLPTVTDIINSKTQLSRYPEGNEMGQLQRGLDGKIYMAQYRKTYLSIINSPNVAGTGCGFVTVGINLPNQGQFSLPNFINDYNYGGVPDSFSMTTGSCVNLPVQFNYILSANVTSVLWNFGDPSSGPQNSSILNNPIHTFSSPGLYAVKLIKYGVCGNDTLTKQINIGDVIADLGIDKSFCNGSTVLLDPASQGTNSFSWQDGTTNQTYTASTSGLYWVQVSSNINGCIKRDSIILTTKPTPIISLGKDTSLCIGQSLLLNAQNPGASYLWNNSAVGQTLLVGQSGSYWVRVTNNGCAFTDTIMVKQLLKPVFTLGPDQLICAGQTIQLKINLSGVNYVWQDGSTSSMYNVNKDGFYFADVTNQCGTTRDSIIFIKSECVVYVPNAFTPNNDGKNDLFRASGTGSVTEFEMNVYSRWGQLVFSTKDKSKGWNGIFSGMPQPDGVYVWTIRFKTTSNPKQELKKGTVMLIR